ncbi:MAG: cupin domain-containing protein [Marivibrio sp.]|uniref:cupin domain-containing protein n=1 Tax=Marivibrio sp. TaxID=2039719 RepID=UPI0032EF0CBE
MTPDDFRKEAAARGFEAPIEKSWEAGRVNAMHTHDGALYLLGLAGEMTVVYDDGSPPVVLGPGATVEVPGGVVHEERAGPDGVRFLAAVRG